MVKGKRRTVPVRRSSKDENSALQNTNDGPKAAKDCRLDTKMVNGTCVKKRHNKMTDYFSATSTRYRYAAQRSVPTTGGNSTPTKFQNGHIESTSNSTYSPNQTLNSTYSPNSTSSSIHSPNQTLNFTYSPSKRTVCTRSQALKELQLQNSTSNSTSPSNLQNSTSNSTYNSNNSPLTHQNLTSNSTSPSNSTSSSTPNLQNSTYNSHSSPLTHQNSTSPSKSTSSSTPNLQNSTSHSTSSPRGGWSCRVCPISTSERERSTSRSSRSTSRGSSDEENESPQQGPPTPHKIQALNEERLRLDSPLSPATALSKLNLSIIPKKLTFNTSKHTKARRKLATSGTTSTGRAGPKKAARVESNGEAAKPTQRDTKVTEFFPIRRSERKPKTALLQERQKEIEDRIKNGSEEGLMVKEFGLKGRGVVTTRNFSKGEFVVEYIGDLIDMKEAKEREKIYALDSTKGCYNYYFTHNNIQYCIDATEETGYLGRLVNHSRNGNLVTKAVCVDGHPHLILLAKRDLQSGTEILYDYGDRSKEALQHHPWLAS